MKRDKRDIGRETAEKETRRKPLLNIPGKNEANERDIISSFFPGTKR